MNQGSDRQRDAFQALIELDVFSILADYNPMLTGTYPLDIETEESDLDIICNVVDLDAFDRLVAAAYGDEDAFQQWRTEKNDLPVSVATFQYHGFSIELFAQPKPVEEQNAYRHMMAEGRLLRAGGEDALAAIRQLKQDKMETEPAFAEYFCLEGDPYEAVLRLADATFEEVDDVVVQARVARRTRHTPISHLVDEIDTTTDLRPDEGEPDESESEWEHGGSKPIPG